MDNRLSILHVISNLNAGGAEKMVVTTANLFVSRGYEVGVVLLVGGGSLCNHLDSRVKLHVLNRRSRFDLRALRSFSDLANSYQITHVHLKHNFKFVFVANVVRNIKSPIVLHDHSAEVLTSGVQKTKLPFFIQFWLRRKFYIGVSESLVKWAIQNFKLNEERCFSLPNAIVCSQKTNEIEEYIPVDGVIRLILVSNFRRIKNIEFGLKLVRELLNRGLAVNLDIYGHILDKAYYSEIVDLARQLNLINNIKINTNETDISVHLNKYDLAIHCSKAETGPLVLLEYLCAGLPFVSIDRGEVTSVVVKQFSEMVVRDYQLDQWCSAISRIDRKNYKDSLQSFFEKEFSPNIYFDRLMSVYNKLAV